jgi:hypothetical protein|tara:strand:+ start:36 stop:536 length:501 start_codon:yes stop_codon:yes gene_type:complete
MGKRTCCSAYHNSGINLALLFIFLNTTWLPAAEPDSTLDISASYLQTIPLLMHLPPKIVFDDRLTKLQLYVDIPEDSIETVSIFYRTNTMENMQEIILAKEKGSYSFNFDPGIQGGDSVAYFFTVAVKDQSIHATPLDINGKIKPYNKPLVDAIKYYEERLKSLKW